MWQIFGKMRKFLLIIAVLSCSLSASAQFWEKMKSATKKVDEVMTDMYYKADYDTAYIGRPDYKWTFALRSFFDWTDFYIHAKDDEAEFSSKLRTEFNPSISIYGGYLGYGAGFSKSLNWFKGKQESDWDFTFSSYGGKFGFELAMRDIHSLGGKFKYNDDDGLNFSVDLPEDFVSQIGLDFNCYYAINHKKFSYPAAFSYSYIQKRSAGSLLVGGYINVNITAIGDSLSGTELVRTTNASLGFGVGYAYNLVLPHNWLIHVSALPYLVLYGATQNLLAGDYKLTSTAEFPECYIVGRSAITHRFGRWFFGATGHVVYYDTKCDIISTRDMQWEVIGYLGVML